MGTVVDFSPKNTKAEKPSKAELIYFSHSTVLIVTETNKKILIDPWLKEEGNPTCPENFSNSKANKLDDIDAIVLTHGHSDHTASTLRIAETSGAQVFAVYELANLLVKDGLKESQAEGMGKGGRVKLTGTNIYINLTQAFHSSSYDMKDGSTHYAGEPAGVVVELENGKSIYHAGDTLMFDDMSLIAAKFSPEIALLPIGDRYTMGPQDAAKAADLISPKQVIPIHYGTFDALTGTVEEFEECLKKSSFALRVIEPGASIEI